MAEVWIERCFRFSRWVGSVFVLSECFKLTFDFLDTEIDAKIFDTSAINQTEEEEKEAWKVKWKFDQYIQKESGDVTIINFWQENVFRTKLLPHSWTDTQK